MNKTLFISEQFLKDISTVNLNVDSKVIMNSILYAQEMNILPVCGSNLYNELITQVTNNSLTEANSNLIENYIKLCLVQFTLFELVDYLVYRFEPKGVLKLKSDNAEVISRAEILDLKEKFRDKGEWYATRLSKYLCANSSLYPAYSVQSAQDALYPKKENFSIGLYLPTLDYSNKKSEGRD